MQEKATFLQVLGKADVYSGVMVLPAVMVLLLTGVGVAVMYVHAGGSGRAASYVPVPDEEG